MSTDKKLQEAIQRRDGLRQELSELPSLRRTLVQEMAGVSSKPERRKIKERLDDLAVDEMVLPTQVEEAEFTVEELRSASLVAEASELEAQAKPLSEEGFEARQKREYWQAVEQSKLSEADSMTNRAFRLRRQAAEIGRQLSGKKEQARQYEEVVGPATKAREVVIDTLR